MTIAALMEPLQYNLRGPTAKDNSIMHAAMAPSNLDAAITMRSAQTQLQNTKELRATVSEIAAPKQDLDATAKKNTISKHFAFFLQGKSPTKIAKICRQIPIAAFMQPLQYDLRCPAAQDRSIPHAAVAPSNLDAAITMRSASRESTNAKKHAHMNNHPVQNTNKEPIAVERTAAAPVAHRR